MFIFFATLFFILHFGFTYYFINNVGELIFKTYGNTPESIPAVLCATGLMFSELMLLFYLMDIIKSIL